MKEKVIIFLVGLLLGAIISTGSIYIYTVANNKNTNEMNMQIPDNIGQGGNMRENPPEILNNDFNNKN